VDENGNDKWQRWGRSTRVLRRTLMHRQEGRCTGCGIEEWRNIERTFDIHRIEKKGRYHPDNCILLCRQCHQPLTQPHKTYKRKDLDTVY
jgi:hypothetical protein